MPFIWQRPFGVIPYAGQIHFCFNYCFGDSVAYFLEVIMLISLKGTLIQIRTKLNRVTFLCKGPMRCRYVVIMVKIQFYRYYVQLLFFETKSLII